MSIRSYKDLVVWQKSIDLVIEVYRLTSGFPSHERFGVISQMRRAAISIHSNIAEGNGRATPGEYLNQLSVSQGSVNEVETLLIVSGSLSFATEEQIAPVAERLTEVGRMLTGLRSALRRKRAP